MARNTPDLPYSPLQIRQLVGLADQFVTPIDKVDPRWVWRVEDIALSTLLTRSIWFTPSACAQMGYSDYEKSLAALLRTAPNIQVMLDIYRENPKRMPPPVLAFYDDGTIDIGSGRRDILLARHLGWASLLCITARRKPPVVPVHAA